METIVKDLQTKIKELNKATKREETKRIVEEIDILKGQMVELTDKMPEGFPKVNYYKQIKDVENRVKKHFATSSREEQMVTVSERHTVSASRRSVTEEDVLIKIVEKEITSKDLKISPQQLDEILKRMRVNQQVMQEIAQIVHETGDNIEKLDEHIDKAYNDVKQANKQLNEANEIQISNRIMKIRLFAGSIFGLIGSKLFGVFGLIGGLFFGYKSGSVLKS